MVLKALEKAKLNLDKGPLKRTRSKISKKDRRNSGRITPRMHAKDNLNYLRENCLLPEEEWDDWVDWRDGWRDYKNERFIKVIYMGKIG